MNLINELDAELVKGRIIDSIENKSVNYFLVRFTDGSLLEIESVYCGNGLYGMASEFHEQDEYPEVISSSLGDF